MKSAARKDVLSVMNLAVPRVVHWAEKMVVHSVAQMVGKTEAH